MKVERVGSQGKEEREYAKFPKRGFHLEQNKPERPDGDPSHNIDS